ncbi:MAG: DUF1844 domain-containing protein [Acidobacteriota bacterium]
MAEKNIKVTDRRMFTPDGELREEYRDLESASPPEARDTAPAREPEPARPEAGPQSSEQAPAGRSAGGRLREFLGGRGGGREAPAAEPPAAEPEPVDEPPSASFRDLVGLLAQSASVYLQQAAQLQVDRRAEAIEMARLHVDLLHVLQHKTAGNLDAHEKALLDDALYQLRMAFVEFG